jgi:hypothetical protein
MKFIIKYVGIRRSVFLKSAWRLFKSYRRPNDPLELNGQLESKDDLELRLV